MTMPAMSYAAPPFAPPPGRVDALVEIGEGGPVGAHATLAGVAR
jgi:hypothetical protein